MMRVKGSLEVEGVEVMEGGEGIGKRKVGFEARDGWGRGGLGKGGGPGKHENEMVTFYKYS